MVLAVDALQVAVGKEYVADAFGAAERWLFAAMYTDGGCFRLWASLAEAVCDSAVDRAMTGTVGAIHDAKLHFFLQINY